MLPQFKNTVSRVLKYRIIDIARDLRRLSGKRVLSRLLILAVVFGFGALSTYFYITHINPSLVSGKPTPDPYLAFSLEIYDKIKSNYWDKIPDEQLINLYKLAAEKVSGKPQNLVIPNKQAVQKTQDLVNPNPLPQNGLGLSLNLQGSSVADLKVLDQPKKDDGLNYKIGLQNMLIDDLKGLDNGKKKELVTNIAAAVLANLQPFGRSGLYTSKQEQALKNTVQNINPADDRYADLGLKKGASQDDIKQAYQKKSSQLGPDKSDKAQAELKKAKDAYTALSTPDNQKRYDSTGIEPTVVSKLISDDIAYIRLIKFSPTTYDELHAAAQSLGTDSGPNALILDLRQNVGGAIDSVPYYMGDFLGKNTEAYNFFHQGEYQPFKTTTDKFPSLARFKQVVVLIDGATQSSAETMAAVFKKYHLGVLVGSKTRGWGTVEQVFNLDNQIDPAEKYSVFLVHSLTIGDDNQPIEGKGVMPNVDTQKPDWKQSLFAYFHYQQLTDAVANLLSRPLN